MLQSPTYATARPPAGTASNLAERLTKFLRGKGEGAQQGNQRPGNKENAPSNSSAGPVERVRIGHLSLTSGFKSDPDISVTKAQSSLASSYQAHNSLSHNDDAGKTHTGWPYDGWGNDFPTLDQQQYAPGRSAALTDRDGPSTYDALASHHVPASFGYDGGADPPLPSKAQDLKAAQEAHPNFDYKGVSHADYEINREDPNSGWHKGAVEDYFQDLAARQRKEVSSHQQSSSKRGT